MYVIGFSGGPRYFELDDDFSGLSPLYFHDAAVAIVKDGVPLFAIEEERLSRQKHTNRFPSLGLKEALNVAGCDAGQVAKFAFFFSENFFEIDLTKDAALLKLQKTGSVREIIARNISRALDADIPKEKIVFVRHHEAHAASVYFASRFKDALVMVVDGNGEKESLTIFAGVDGKLSEVHSYPVASSFGYFYRHATQLLGFSNFDEYKVMGLAPYGDAEKFYSLVSKLYRFNQDGSYELDVNGLSEIAYNVGAIGPAEPKSRGWNRKAHLAAAVQKLLEVALQDIASWWQRKLGFHNLCLAGGVAQNCVMNGCLAEAGIFERVYVHPASHDAGAALGAAIHVANTETRIERESYPAYSPLLGPDLPSENHLSAVLKAWSGITKSTRSSSVFKDAASKIADGNIIGWVQGRSEFGPRALGNRSILADPRPKENWQRINLAIKQRESFRPFAPAVLDEDFDEYFEALPAAANLGHMVFVTRVREEKRAELGAVTHVNGTARVQVISEKEHPDFWKLAREFKNQTGCPIILNTSFNNSFEPIVQTVDDAFRTFLTTELDYLFVRDHMVTKDKAIASPIDDMWWKLTNGTWVEEISASGKCAAFLRRVPSYSQKLSWPQLASALKTHWGGTQKVGDLLRVFNPEDRESVQREIISLWRARFIDIHP
ncbi:carbamoyltransferase [Agrobacterium tumefaciens]|uniref:carbamoyltransferase family protein n=1 Tax=Agrobacterium tumefaciens TaxID=358 RepID=UPI001885CD67|nr:carbamoyltransferase C-terminal domain-containing protein [Agrobacterium tumefaciens]